MKVTIFGATGKVGSLLVKEGLIRGWTITAFVHGTTNLPSDPRVTVVSGDIHEREAVAQAINGAEAVISVLGSWGSKVKDIQAAAMANIVPAMENAGIIRIISLTGADAYLEEEKRGVLGELSHAVFGAVVPKILHDGEEHLRILKHSDLEWTVVRSPVMASSDDSAYRLVRTAPLPWSRIARAAVVRAMADLAEGTDFSREAPFLRHR